MKNTAGASRESASSMVRWTKSLRRGLPSCHRTDGRKCEGGERRRPLWRRRDSAIETKTKRLETKRKPKTERKP